MYGGLRGIGDDVHAAVEYLRSKWSEFVNLYQRIIDAQHRAAVAARDADLVGDTETGDQARAVVRELRDLQEKHDAVVRRMEPYASVIGLGGYRGLGIVFTAAQITVITALALTVTWFFRAYAAEARKLDMIEAGTLTPEQAAALDASVGAAPGAVLGNVTRIGTLLLWGGLAFIALQAFQAYQAAVPRGRTRRNPPLLVFDRNPPDADADVMAEQVYGVWYRHAEDGGNWFHEFGPDVEMFAEPDGSVSIAHSGGRRVWEDF
jgi:hypothetical protein